MIDIDPEAEMNRAELKQIVSDEGLGNVAFLDAEGVRENAAVLQVDEAGWTVYMTTERAGFIPESEAHFASESEALEYMLERLRNKARTRRLLAAAKAKRKG